MVGWFFLICSWICACRCLIVGTCLQTNLIACTFDWWQRARTSRTRQITLIRSLINIQLWSLFLGCNPFWENSWWFFLVFFRRVVFYLVADRMFCRCLSRSVWTTCAGESHLLSTTTLCTVVTIVVVVGHPVARVINSLLFTHSHYFVYANYYIVVSFSLTIVINCVLNSFESPHFQCLNSTISLSTLLKCYCPYTLLQLTC